MAADTFSISGRFHYETLGHASKPSRIEDEVFPCLSSFARPFCVTSCLSASRFPMRRGLQDVFLKLFQHLRQGKTAPTSGLDFPGSA